jgi:hypothetical protein
VQKNFGEGAHIGRRTPRVFVSRNGLRQTQELILLDHDLGQNLGSIPRDPRSTVLIGIDFGVEIGCRTDERQQTPSQETAFHGSFSFSGLESSSRLSAQIPARSKMVRPERIELPTSWFVAKHSIQLSYGRIVADLRFWIIAETEAFRRTCPPKNLVQNAGRGCDFALSDSRQTPHWLWKSVTRHVKQL